MRGSHRRHAIAVAAGLTLVVGVALVATLAAGPTLAGDQPTVIYPASESQTAAQGETVEVDIRVRSDGGVNDIGVESMTVNATYNRTMLTATDVEPASWLDGDEPTEVETESTIDNATGKISVTQWREPPAGGTTGDGLFATVTFDVAADAPATNTTVSFDDSAVLLTDQFPAPIHSNNATVTVEETAGNASASEVSPAVAGAALVVVAAVLVVGAAVVRRW